jgi:hypothetical protein
VLTASLVTWQGCRTQTAVTRLVSGGFGASWVVGTCLGAVLVCVGACFVVF